jgi:arginase family enzyme
MPWERATVPDRTSSAGNGPDGVANTPESRILSEVALFRGLPAKQLSNIEARLCYRSWTVALVHFDTHADTSAQVFGIKMSHGTIMPRLVDDGHVALNRYAQGGLRGYWPGEKELSWQAEHGITSPFMHDVRDLGIGANSLSWKSPLAADRVVREILGDIAP